RNESDTKTIKPQLQLNYDDIFNSPANLNIRQKLVSELKKSLEPNYRPSVFQITRWLSSLHKSRRSQNRLRQT
ncbi:13089_t:CDS:1, partial [Funneliformis caledonium]